MGSNPPGPYHHWLDDAAQMGLMLYRMRNDSKRERLQQQRHPAPPPHQHPQSPPAASAPPPTPGGRMVPVLQYPPLVQEPTPRTAAALQTPTVVHRGGTNAVAGINSIQSLD